jgi:hypothetical protein
MLELGIPLHIFDREKIAGDKVFIPDYFKFIRPIEETTTVVVKKSKEEAVKEFISSLK